MQSGIDTESESEKEIVDSTITSVKALYKSEVPKLEIPLAVQNVISRIEHAQLCRAREDINMQLADILLNVQRIINRYTVDENVHSGRKISLPEHKKWRINFLDKIVTYAKNSEIREKTLLHILVWLEEWNAILSEMTAIDIEEHHHWIAKMEFLPEMYKAIESNVKILSRISVSLFEEKKRQKKKITSRGTLWKSWKERVIKRPATAHALRPDQMISDEFATNTKVSEIQDMLQELINTAMFNKLENNAIKYISSTIVNLSKALKTLNDEVKVFILQSANMYTNETSEKEKELSLKIIRDLSEQNEILQQKLQDAEEKYEQFIQSKGIVEQQLPTALPTSTLKALPELSPQSSIAISKTDIEDSMENILAKEFENIIDEAQTQETKALGIQWDSAFSYTAPAEMTPDLIEQQYPLPEKNQKESSEGITEDKVSLKKDDDQYQSQKKKQIKGSSMDETSGSHLSDDKGKQKETKLDHDLELQALEKNRKEMKSFSEAKPKSFAESKSRYVPTDYPSTDTKRQSGKSGTGRMWERLRKVKPEYSHDKSQISSENKEEPTTESMDKESKSEMSSQEEQFKLTELGYSSEKMKTKGKKHQISPRTTTSKEGKTEDIIVLAKKFKSPELVKSQSRIAKETSESMRVLESPDGKSEESNLEEFQKAIMAFLNEKIDNIGKPLDKKAVPKEGLLLKTAEVEKLEIIKAKMEEYFQTVAETVAKILREYKDIKNAGQVGEKPMKRKKEVSFMPGLHFQKPISAKAEISTLLSSKSMDPLIDNLIQMILTEIEGERDALVASTVGRHHKEKEKQRWDEYLQEGQEKVFGEGLKHHLQEEGSFWKKSHELISKKLEKEESWLQVKERKQRQQKQKWWQEEEAWKEQQKQTKQDDEQMQRKEKEYQKTKQQQLEAWNQEMEEQLVPLEEEEEEQMRPVQKELRHPKLEINREKEEKQKPRRNIEDHGRQKQKKTKDQRKINEKNSDTLEKMLIQTSVTVSPKWKSIPKVASQLHQRKAFHGHLKTLENFADGKHPIPITPSPSTQSPSPGAFPISGQSPTKTLTLTPQQAQELEITITPQKAKGLGITVAPEQAQTLGISLTPEQAQEMSITDTLQKALGITVTPQQAQALGIPLTPEQAQPQGITLTPQQAQALGITLTPEQAQALRTTVTPQQAKAQGITLTPQQEQALGITFIPEQTHELGFTFTDKQAQAHGITLTPKQAQELGITLTYDQAQALGTTVIPQQSQSQGITLTPEQAHELGFTFTEEQTLAQGITLTPEGVKAPGITVTPDQVQEMGITVTPQQAQALEIMVTPEQSQTQGITLTSEQAQTQGITLTPEQAQAGGITLTSQQAQALGITLSPEQAQTQGITLTLEQAQALGITLTPQQAQAGGITLIPQQAQAITLTPQQPQALGITLTHEQAQAQGITLTPEKAQAQGITLTPEQAQVLGITLTPQQAQAITLTPQQAQAQGITLTPEQAQAGGITLTPQQAQAQAITLTPEQAQAKGITLIPKKAQAQGVTLTPEQAQAQGISLTPEKAQAQGITLTPEKAQAQGITLTPEQAQAQGVTLTPEQAQAQGIPLISQRAQAWGNTLTPEKAQAQGITLTPQQAQALGITLTPQQAQAQEITLTPEQAQALGISLTPEQTQAQGISLTPEQAQAQGISLTPEQAQAGGITLTPQQAQAINLTPQQAQAQGITLTPEKAQAQGISLTPQQAQAQGITLTPEQAQAQRITLTLQQAQAQGISLTPEQAQAQGVTMTLEHTQARGIPLVPEQAQAQAITLTPQQAQTQRITLTPEQAQAQGISLTSEQAQALGITLTTQQAQAQGVTLTPQQAQAINLTPQQAQAQGITLTAEQAQVLGLTLTPQQAQAGGITLTPQQAQAQGITLTPEQAQALGISLTPEQAQAQGITLTPQQAQARGITVTLEQAEALGITLTPEQAEALGITLTPEQFKALVVTLSPEKYQGLGFIHTLEKVHAWESPLTASQAQKLGVPITPENAWVSAVTLTPEQTQALGAPLSLEQAQALGISLSPEHFWESDKSDKSHVLGFPLTLEQVQPLGAPFIPGQSHPMGVDDLKSRAPLINEQLSPLGVHPLLEHTLKVGIVPVTDKSVTPSAPHISKKLPTLDPSSLRSLQKLKASVLPRQSPASAAIAEKSSALEVSPIPLQISHSPLSQVPGKSLGVRIRSEPGKLLAPQTFPSSKQTLFSKGQSTSVEFVVPEVPLTPEKFPIAETLPTLGQPLTLETLLGPQQFFSSWGSRTPQLPLISEAPLASRQPLISGVPLTSAQIPDLLAPLSPRKPLVPGTSSIHGELLEPRPLTLSEQPQAFQPAATCEQSHYLQAPSPLGQRQASPLWIPPTPGHLPTLWTSPTPGKPLKDLSSSVSKKSKERLAIISSLKPNSAFVHPSATDFKVTQAPFTTKKFQISEASDTLEEIPICHDPIAMEQFRTFQSYLTNYRTPVSQTPYIPTLMKPVTSLPSLTTKLPKTSQISSSEWDQKSKFPPIDKSWILTSVSGTKKPKMLVPPSTPQELKEQRYFVDVEAQRKNLILLNQATKASGLPSQLHTTARNLIIESLHMDTVRLGYLFRKYIAYRLIQRARNNLIRRLQVIKNTGKGYETRNLYIMLSRIDEYQKKVMQVWTNKQKSLEQKRNQCLRKMILLFSQLQQTYKLNLSQPIPCIIDKKQIPASTKSVQQSFLELLIEEDRKSDTLKKFRQEDQMEAIWNADLSTSSYPVTEKTSIHSLWAQLGGYPDIPMLLQLDVQSTFRKSLGSIKSQFKKIPK
ncbi:protein FAM186A isoform X3 [Panthera tigris]|uniref:protein FAM186A isoform X3 n=1 Tax=Panthera tigris TaxID=9694 RepID=UPI001C6FB264|nr:protein FAM186A isoform X3 [Panthera tigris]